MRPITLKVSGFMCFRDEQAPLDFSELELFAISGPTGAGKSSVLDAMTYALYGKVPRMGRGSVRELISHGRDRMTVTFEFSVHDRRFLVARSTRRTGTSAVQMDELHGTTSSPLAEGARQVQQAVARVVGLDYDAFTQAVMLPQGDFARFLKGDRAQRRLILQELLRLTVYGRMRELANEQCKDARRSVEMLEQQLEAYVMDTPDALTQADAERTDVVTRLPVLQQHTVDACTRRDQLRVLVARTLEQARRRADLHALDAQAPAQQARVLRIEASRRARELQGPLDQLARDQQLQAARRDDALGATRRLEAARRAIDEAGTAVTVARQASAEMPTLSAQVAALRALEGRIQHRDAVVAECEGLARALAVAEDDLSRQALDAAAGDRQVSKAIVERTRAEAALAQAGFDDRELAACEAGRDLARELARDRREGPAMSRRVHAAIVDGDETARSAARELEALDAARQACERIERERVEAATSLAAAQDLHRAMTLRGHLEPGHTCPVCEQPVAVVPPAELPPELTELFDAVKETAEARRTAELLVWRQQEKQIRAATAAEGAAHARDAARQQHADLGARIADSAARLIEVLGIYLPASAASMPEHWLLERLEALRALQTRRDACERQRQIAHAVAVDSEHTRTLARQARASCEQEVLARREALGDKQRLGQRLEEEVASVTRAADPRAELSGLTRRVQALEQNLDTARAALARHDVEHAAAAEALRHAGHALAGAAQSHDAIAASVAHALAASGFGTPADAIAARLSPADETRLVQQSDEHAAQAAALAARLRELALEIGAAPVTEAQLATAEQEVRDAEQCVGDAVQRRATLDVTVVSLRRRVDERALLRATLARARGTMDTHGLLATDLQANAFQDWLLAEVFDRIVEGASTRLMELSSRYTLQWDDGEFHVIDHDNARERRTADTLSGGETFLASLALALELSEQVQRAAGAVRLDSLFIDEGFGTLDASAQDVVASAMESLRVTGRMIGIITHIRELTDRMPASVHIDKRPDGSRWSVQTTCS